jgi:cytochrome c peroxidase
MFHDGRVELAEDQPHGFRSPAGAQLPAGLDNVLAVQAMFPVTSGAEMAGQAGENTIADLAAAGNLPGIWAELANRLRSIPAYVDLFMSAYPEITSASDITYVHAANAIAAFEAHDWRFDNTPFDRYLRGDKQALSPSQKKGMILFYGQANCAACHSGKFQTDHAFYAVAMPQIGPGKGDGVNAHEDFGRERVTGELTDRYRFRTSSLRNIALTGPWGHAGAYRELRDAVKHMLNPSDSIQNYDTTQAVLPPRADLQAIDFEVMQNSSLVQLLADTNEAPPVSLTEAQIDHLIDFLHALTDPRALNLTRDIPWNVPSGLLIAD